MAGRHRFYVPPQSISGDRVVFTADQRRQMRSVLRLRRGDAVSVFDSSGKEYLTQVEGLDDTQATGKVIQITCPQTEPQLRLTLVQGLPKGEKIELILQKCTEIGVSEFLIVETARSVPRIPEGRLAARLERWRAVVREAAEQSGRTRLPEVRGAIAFTEALGRARGKGIIAWEEAKELHLAEEIPRLSQTDELSCFVGPEGGFTAEEVAAAEDVGITAVSLGPRILRTETAAIVGCALLMYGSENA